MNVPAPFYRTAPNTRRTIRIRDDVNGREMSLVFIGTEICQVESTFPIMMQFQLFSEVLAGQHTFSSWIFASGLTVNDTVEPLELVSF